MPRADESQARDATVDPGWAHSRMTPISAFAALARPEKMRSRRVALALMNVVTDVDRVQPQQLVEVTCEGDRHEILLVEWLNALIFEMATKKMLFSRFVVTIEEGNLRGQAWGEPIDFFRHELIVEVKGATFTELKVGEEPDGRWVAQCVVDV